MGVHDGKFDTYYREASVLINGASGFIGTHLCRRLSQLKHRSRVFI